MYYCTPCLTALETTQQVLIPMEAPATTDQGASRQPEVPW